MVRRSAVWVLAVALLTGLFVAVGPGVAQALPRSFWVHNFTATTLRITKYQNWEESFLNLEAPGEEVIIEPGEMLQIDLDAPSSLSNGPNVQYDFDVLDDTDAAIGAFWLAIYWAPNYGRDSRGAFTKRTAGSQGMTLDFQNQDIFLNDKKGDIDITNMNAERQADFVANMCDSDRANCFFQLTGDRKPAVGEERDLIVPIENYTCAAVPEKLKTVDKRTLSNKWGVEIWFKGGVKGSWESGIKAKYEGSYVTSHDFEQETEFHIPPRYVGRWVATVPVYRYTGVYTIVASRGPGTRWRITGLTVDSPHPQGFTKEQNKGVAIKPRSRPITEPIDPTTLAVSGFPKCPAHLEEGPAPGTFEVQPQPVEPDPNAADTTTPTTAEQTEVGRDDTRPIATAAPDTDG